MSDESVKPPATSNNSLAPALSYIGIKTRVKCDGSCLKQNKIAFTHGNLVSIYITYEIHFWDRGYDDYPVLENSLFGAGAVNNFDTDYYEYSGHGIGFDRRGNFSVPGWSRRSVMYLVLMWVALCILITRGKTFWFLVKVQRRGLNGTTYTAEDNDSINFTELNKNFV